jgi:hypothetical protein
MAIVTSPNFRRAVLTALRPLLQTFWLRLFVNNVVPVIGFSSASYQEPSGGWYHPIPLTLWGMPFQNASLQGEIDETIRTYTAAFGVVAEVVYGYWVTDQTGLLCWAERGPAAPYPMSAIGDVVRVLPRLMDGLLC